MVRIISDSTCDLSAELLERYEIGLIPLHIVLHDKEYRDTIEITPEQIYAWSDEHKETPKTSAPSIDDVIEILKQNLEDGSDVVAFSIASGMSTSGNVIRLAAEELDASDRVTVIDSQNLSTGIGLLVIKAAEMAHAGRGAAEIVAEMERLRPLVRASFVVDTLVYLYRGGRCSGTAALAGSVLKIHPKISVEDGAMQVGKKYTGRLERAIKNYVGDLDAGLANADPARVFITHSGCKAETVEAVRAMLAEKYAFDEILETRAGGVVSSHCGPGTLGVLFISK